MWFYFNCYDSLLNALPVTHILNVVVDNMMLTYNTVNIENSSVSLIITYLPSVVSISYSYHCNAQIKTLVKKRLHCTTLHKTVIISTV